MPLYSFITNHMLTAASTTDIVQTGFTQFSTAALLILGFAIGIAVGIFIYKWGKSHLFRSARGH